MKAVKIAAWVLGGFVVVVLLLVLIAFLPPVQTWAVRRALAAHHVDVSVGRVAAGWSSATVRAVRYESGGVVVTVRDGRVAYSIGDYLHDGAVHLADIEAHDVEVDASHPAPSGPSSSSASNARPLGAFVAPIRLPVDVRIGRVAVEGEALLPDGRTATFSASGGGIGTGRTGRLDWRIDYADANLDAALRSAHAEGDLEIGISGERRVTELGLDGELSAAGPQIPTDRLALHVLASQPSIFSGKSMSAAISLVRGGQATPLLTLRTEWAPGTSRIEGEWTASVPPGALAPYLAAVGLPSIAADGTGRFTADAKSGATTMNGQFGAGIEDLAKVSPALAGVGRVRFAADFSGGFSGHAVRIDRLKAQGLDAKGQAFLELDSVQPISFDLADSRAEFAQPTQPLARFSVQALPLAWLDPAVKPLAIEGGELSGALDVEADPNGRRIRVLTAEPFAVHGFTLSRDGEPLLSGVDATVSPQFDYVGGRFAAALKDVTVSLAAGDRISGKATMEAQGLAPSARIAFTLDYDAHLISLVRRFLPFDPGPVEAQSSEQGWYQGGELTVTAGRHTLSEESGTQLLALDVVQPVTADFATGTLQAEDPGGPALRLRIGELPLAWFQAATHGAPLQGDVRGGVLDIALPGPGRASVRCAEPVSVMLQGRPAPLFSLTQLRANLAEGEAAGPEACALDADVRIPDFDLGGFLQAESPNEPPFVETEVALTARLRGAGKNPADLAQHVEGDFELSGSKGVLRAFRNRTGVVVGGASKVLGLFGQITGSKTTQAVGDVAAQLTSMPFDSFQAQIERGRDLNVQISRLDFSSSDKHLAATGTIRYEPGVPLTGQPLHLDFQLGAKDQFAFLLNRLDLLGTQEDAKGYQLLTSSFAITGTLAHPDSSQLWKILEGAAGKKAFGGLSRLFGH